MDTASAPEVGRRERNMREKQNRIHAAAAELFAARGFEAVSTGEIARQADVAAGTVFRYAATKGELLLMVLNDELRQDIDTGAQRARAFDDTADAIEAMIAPIIDYAARHPDNSRVYQRELLFGDPADHYRAAGLALAVELQRSIADRLIADAKQASLQPDTDSALLVGNMIFGVTHLTLARPSTGTHPERDSAADIRNQIEVAVVGYFGRLSPAAPGSR